MLNVKALWSGMVERPRNTRHYWLPWIPATMLHKGSAIKLLACQFPINYILSSQSLPKWKSLLCYCMILHPAYQSVWILQLVTDWSINIVLHLPSCQLKAYIAIILNCIFAWWCIKYFLKHINFLKISKLLWMLNIVKVNLAWHWLQTWA